MLLGYSMNECRLQRMLGGSFGGKEEDLGCLVGRCCNAFYLATRRPVEMVNSREESLMDSAKDILLS